MTKRITRVGLFMLAAILIIATFTACFFGAKDKTFEVGDLKITLTDQFVEKEIVGQTAMFQSTNVLVTVLMEEKSLIGNGVSLERYAELVCNVNGLKDSEIELNGDRAEFTYEKTVSGKDYKYFAKCYKTDEAYWLVQFACFEDSADKYVDNIEKWADTVKFE